MRDREDRLTQMDINIAAEQLEAEGWSSSARKRLWRTEAPDAAPRAGFGGAPNLMFSKPPLRNSGVTRADSPPR